MKALFRILHLVVSLAGTQALADDRIRIEIGPPNRAVEVISPTFFDERTRPPQVIANRYGQLRYYGDAPSVASDQRQTWIEECQQSDTQRLRVCYKAKQRAGR